MNGYMCFFIAANSFTKGNNFLFAFLVYKIFSEGSILTGRNFLREGQIPSLKS